MLTQTNDLHRSTPEKQGIASPTILDFIEALDNKINGIHSFMLLRHGYVVAEGCWLPYRSEYPHMLYSVSKSVTSTAVGIAIDEGYFSLNDTVLSFFPNHAPSEPDEFLKIMRVQHLLTMSTGHDVDTLTRMAQDEDSNWIKAFLSASILYEPGTHFMYNTGATYMLSAIVQTTTSMKLVDFLDTRLFEPLHIENATWDESPQGIALGGIGLSVKTEDIAKFGQLYLQKGIWQGNQIVPQTWINEATRLQISNGNYPDSDWTQGYGYQFWRCRYNAYRADGVFGQFCIVMPEQDAVLAMTGGHDCEQDVLEIIWEKLLPAMQTTSLPEDTTTQKVLNERLSNLASAPVQGQVSSPIATQVSGQTYLVDSNDLGIKSIRLDFTAMACTISLKTESNEQLIPCGYGTWEIGRNSLFAHPWVLGSTPMLSSSAWIDEDCFSVIVRLYETPFLNSLVFHFIDDELLLEILANVSLESITPYMLTAYADKRY